MSSLYMSYAVNKRLFVLSALMLLAAANSIAMSLGRQRGAALIGRPLDISVQAVLDAQDDIAKLCLDADVFYADTKIDKSRVRVTAEKVSPGTQDAVIRIRSTSLVDEPVVSIYLRVGCQQKTERRYVTLADLATDVLPERNVAMPVAPSLQVRPPQLTAPSAASSVTPYATSSAASPTANVSTVKPTKKAKRSLDPVGANTPPQASDRDNPPAFNSRSSLKKERTAAAAALAKSGSANRARLKLEPLDLSIERDPQLKSSTELLSVPASSPLERSAAAALWKAISAQPQDILRDTEKLQSLESSTLSLQTQNQKSQQVLNEMGVKLQQAQAERYANALVYALVFLLLLALAGLAYLMRGQYLRRQLEGGDKPWWRKHETKENPRSAWADSDGHIDIFNPDQPTSTKKNKSGAVANSDMFAADQKSNAVRSEPKSSKLNSIFGPDSMPPLASKYTPDFSLGIPYSSRMVKAEELFDVQQQADFFVSIDQHEQAIDVLRNHIGDNVETSALVYLDLFNLYHHLERKSDYALLREDFNQRFHAKIPVFELYTDVGPGLDSYPSAMSRIEALWPSPKVLEVIEESIFRQPETNVEAFNLVAYRELLMLYSVAKEIIGPDIGQAERTKKPLSQYAPADNFDSGPLSFLTTSIQPLSANIMQGDAAHAAAVMDPVFASTVPPASLNLGLDLDLSEPMPDTDNALPVDVSDVSFFAQFDINANAALPELNINPESQSPRKGQRDPDNLIDFDAFDMPRDPSGKLK